MHCGFLSNSLPNTYILPLYTFMVPLLLFNACIDFAHFVEGDNI